MDFKNDISQLDITKNNKIKLEGTSLPTCNDIFFRAKQKELIEQYSAARIFLKETETNDWDHWYKKMNDKNDDEAIRQILRSHFYETALFFYNVVIDLSWTMCYVAAEFVCESNGKRIDLTGIQPIDIAVDLLRKNEKNVIAPSASDNPFMYLKNISPDFEPVINLIIDFWNKVSDTEIRNNYNYCKHKGRPLYIEIENLSSGRYFQVYEQRNNGTIQYASNIQDVQYSISLEDAINKLKDFDENQLYNYIKQLICLIEKTLKPSPLVGD